MKGHVRKRGRNWSYIIDIGRINGKRKQKEKGGFRTKKDAEAALAFAISEVQSQGEIFECKKITFQELFEEFLKYEAVVKQANTIKRYKSIYNNHFNNLIGHKYIYSINQNEIEEYLLAASGTHAASYIKSMINTLNSILNFAVSRKYIKESPIKNLKKPTVQRKKKKVYSQEEIKKISNRIRSTNLHPPFFVALSTGMRAGEVYALRWSDVDFDNDKIVIDKQLQYIDYKWSYDRPKTESGNRTIDMQPVLKEYLTDLKLKQSENKEVLKDYYVSNKIFEIRDNKTIIVDDMIMVKPNGEMLNTYSHKYISRVSEKELGIDFKFHNLRDTHASMLLSQGANIIYIQKRLGHARPSITLDVYSDVLPDDKTSLKLLDETTRNLPTS